MGLQTVREAEGRLGLQVLNIGGWNYVQAVMEGSGLSLEANGEGG